VIFEPGVIRQFVAQPPFDDQSAPIKVNAKIAMGR
jgi:phosphatidylserine decarboxylase